MGVNVLTQKMASKSFISLIYFLQSANVRTGEDVDDLIMGMASQIAEREDNIVVEDLRGIKPPPFFSPLPVLKLELICRAISLSQGISLAGQRTTV